MALHRLLLFQDEALHLDMEFIPETSFNSTCSSGRFLFWCCGMIPIALVDVPYQMYKHNKEMKMTKQEVKDERKNRKATLWLKVEFAVCNIRTKRMMQEVPQADVVTNPTHFSVAIKYDYLWSRKGLMNLPCTSEKLLPPTMCRGSLLPCLPEPFSTPLKWTMRSLTLYLWLAQVLARLSVESA